MVCAEMARHDLLVGVQQRPAVASRTWQRSAREVESSRVFTIYYTQHRPPPPSCTRYCPPEVTSGSICHEPSYSESDSCAAEDILLAGGGGDLRYTLSLRPVMSFSASKLLTRSMLGFALKRSSSSKQRGDLEAIFGAFAATVGPEAWIENLPRGGGGDLR